MLTPKFNKPVQRPGTGVNSPLDAEGRTALHIAVAQKDGREAQKLIRVGAHPDQPDEKGQSPVYQAIAARDIEMVSLLVKNGASLSLRDKERRSPLEWAIEQKCGIPFLAQLQNLGADPAAQAPLTRRNALHRAAEANRPDVIAHFVAHGMAVNTADGKGNTPLMAAVETGSLDALKKLMALGADPMIRNSEIETALHIAAEKGAAEAAAQLLTHAEVRRDINEYRTYREGFSPLMTAAAHDRADIAKLLVEAGANPNQADNRKRNSLYIAVENGHVETAKALLALGADAVKSLRKNSDNAPLVHQIGDQNYAGMLAVLYRAGVDLNAADNNGQTALGKACEQIAPDKVKALLALGADPDLPNDMGRRPLDVVMDHYSYSYGHGEHNTIIAELLRKGASPDMSALPEMPQAPLHIAAEQGNVKSLELLIAHHAKIDARERGMDGMTPLMCAAQRGQTRAAQFLISKGADLAATDNQGRTIVHYAAQSGAEDLLQTLLDLKVMDIGTVDGKGQSLLHLAARADRRQTMTFLLKNGADPAGFDDEGLTPLHAALVDSYNNDIFDVYQAVLADKAPLDAETRDTGETPLHFAARYGRHWSAEKLLNMGADPLKAAKDGHLPLEDALKDGSFTPIILLLIDKMKEKGFDFKTRRDARGDSLLHKVAAQNNGGAVSFLVAAGVPVDAADAKGDTPLMVAIRNGMAGAVDALLLCNADVMAQNAAGETVFELALQSQDKNVMQAVLLGIQQRQMLQAQLRLAEDAAKEQAARTDAPESEAADETGAPRSPAETVKETPAKSGQPEDNAAENAAENAKEKTKEKIPAPVPEKKSPGIDPKVLKKNILRLPPGGRRP
jgi:serine/threonine-protein phosphatase 6 regulatory ankyrin repeat subunit B